jgi:hypothetical protein
MNATPVTLHTTLSYMAPGEKGAHLRATARNETDGMIRHVRICVVAVGWAKDCLFSLWNEKPIVPGAEISWDVSSPKNITGGLGHFASITEFVGELQPAPLDPAAVSGPSAEASPESPIVAGASNIIRCMANSEGCPQRLREGAREAVLTATGLRIFARMDSPDERYLSFWVTVENKRSSEIEIAPEGLRVEAAGAELLPLQVDEVAGRAGMAELLQQGAAGGLQGTTIGAVHGATLRSVALSAGTVQPGHRTPDGTGAVFFARPAGGVRSLALRIPVGSLVFEFPFEIP